MKKFEDIGVQIPTVYLPQKGVDLNRWAVIACDQFTSEPEYWEKVETNVGSAPSTFRLTLPEIFLDAPDEPAMIKAIQEKMRQTLDEKIVEPTDGFILVKRTVDGKTRSGLMLALDLEKYDFNKGSTSLIRATEGTIIERLPPRMKIREGAELEFPHILVLIDDPQKTVIEQVASKLSDADKVYDFDLMFNSGHLTGYKVPEALEMGVIEALRNLATQEVFSKKYDIQGKPVLLFAMGDGNHSLATAKAIWEKTKEKVGMDHPARYALVEIENVHDSALEFEPIHRVVFGLKKDFHQSISGFFSGNVKEHAVPSLVEMVKQVDNNTTGSQVVGLIEPGNKFSVLEFLKPTTNLSVGTLQQFIDSFMKDGGAEKLDYVHGADVTARLGSQTGNIGFYLPGMDKSDLFKTVILDGALPRKTFSMGEAHEKRFYMESRKIS